jgi:hypothetical protein
LQHAVERYGHVRCFSASEPHVEGVNDAQYSYYDVHQQHITFSLIIKENKLGVGTFFCTRNISHMYTSREGLAWKKRGREEKKRRKKK